MLSIRLKKSNHKKLSVGLLLALTYLLLPLLIWLWRRKSKDIEESSPQQSLPPAQAPEDISPRTQPIEEPSQQQPTTPVEPNTPSEPERVNTQIDYVDEFDNFGLRRRFFEQTTRFPLRNDNQISVKTGFNLFDEIGIEAVTNYPIQVGWQGAVGPLTLQVAGVLICLTACQHRTLMLG